MSSETLNQFLRAKLQELKDNGLYNEIDVLKVQMVQKLRLMVKN